MMGSPVPFIATSMALRSTALTAQALARRRAMAGLASSVTAQVEEESPDFMDRFGFALVGGATILVIALAGTYLEMSTLENARSYWADYDAAEMRWVSDCHNAGKVVVTETKPERVYRSKRWKTENVTRNRCI